MVEVNKFKIGLFVISGFLLFMVVIFLLSGASMFEKKIQLITLINESVQGLEKGSQVKYKGVPIGRVSDITIIMNTNQIQIVMDIDPNAFISEEKYFGTKGESQIAFKNYLESEINKGLRVRLEYAGITGFKYIEMNYFETPTDITKLIEKPKYLDDEKINLIYIQSMPSIFSDIGKNITVALEKLSRVNFDKIAASLESSVGSVNKFMNSGDLEVTMKSVKELSIKLNDVSTSLQVITPEKVDNLYKTLESALVEYKTLASILTKRAEEAKLAATSEAIRDASNSVNESVITLDNTLLKLNNAIDEISTLLRLLNEQPNALIRGKRF